MQLAGISRGTQESVSSWDCASVVGAVVWSFTGSGDSVSRLESVVSGDDRRIVDAERVLEETFSSPELFPECEGVFSGLRLRPRFFNVAGVVESRTGSWGTALFVSDCLDLLNAIGGAEIEDPGAYVPRGRGLGVLSGVLLPWLVAKASGLRLTLLR